METKLKFICKQKWNFWCCLYVTMCANGGGNLLFQCVSRLYTSKIKKRGQGEELGDLLWRQGSNLTCSHRFRESSSYHLDWQQALPYWSQFLPKSCCNLRNLPCSSSDFPMLFQWKLWQAITSLKLMDIQIKLHKT